MNSKILTRNPTTGAVLNEFSLFDQTAIQKSLAQAKDAHLRWRRSPMTQRTQALMNVAKILRQEKDRWADLITNEMGKKKEEAIAEIEKCAACAVFFAENGPQYLAPTPVATEAKKSYVCFEPLGTVLMVMPWNFPFWQAFRCAIPSTLAGNSVLLKHASNVTACALAIEEIFQKAFAEKNILQTLLISGESALALIAHDEISAVSFTGSTEVGRKIAEKAGASLKKCVLELGGSDPYVVLADADLELAAKTCAYSRLINAGQSCISAKRFIVDKKVRSDFEQLFLKEMRAATLAPLARADLRAELDQQVQKSIAMGAKLLCGGKIPTSPGYFYPATVLANVTAEMPAYNEELFGPVASIIEAANTDDAIRIANSSTFGLGAAIFSSSDLGEKIARTELEAGSCFVNTFVRSDSRLPFGGIKHSGYGRELSAFGAREFTNVKTVWVN